MKRSHPVGIVLLAAVFFGMVGQAGARTIDLGAISGPITFSIHHDKLVKPFNDQYLFTVDPGTTLDFSAFVSTGYSNRFWILDMDGTLSDTSGVIVNGDAVTNILPGAGFPDRDVTFPSTLLGPGDYVLAIFGTPSRAFPGPTSSYSGDIKFCSGGVCTSPATTPLPASLPLMLAALAGLALAATRRAAMVA